MSQGTKGLYSFGGISFVISGLLFLVKYGFDLYVGTPPSNGPDILTWVDSNELPLALTNEVLFFAVGFLIPATIALYCSLVSTSTVKATAGCGLFAATIPVIVLLDIFHGRLVYPIYDIDLKNPDIAELIVTTFHGGLHAVRLLLGLATIVLSLAMKRGLYGRQTSYLGLVTGVFGFLGAYPEIIGPVLMGVSEVLFAAWFLAVGWNLYTNASAWSRDASQRATA